MISQLATHGTWRNALLLLLLFVVARATTLEYTDLSDPTESRYATVAQEMALSGNWLTPTLPSAEGKVPYLGKPPLHFWLTALSYTIFGLDEWTSRLPSFLSALLILFLVFKYSQRHFDTDTGLAATLVTVSSGLFFFLAGASVTDVTLTALASGAIITLYAFVSVNDGQASRGYCLASTIFAALAFLCKGPVALVLIGLPFFLWSLVRKDWTWIRRLPWLFMLPLFVALIAPWFIASEAKNPGFLKYFIWNENIARYLFREYGDKYGSGHRHFYGMSWLMLIGGFCPWTLVLLGTIYRVGPRKSWQWVRANPARLFTFCWAITAALFFTFVRQLHIMYILPCVPGLAILTGTLLASPSHRTRVCEAFERLRRPALWGAVLFWFTIIVIGFTLEFSVEALIFSLAILALTALVITKLKDYSNGLGAVGFVTTLFVCLYMLFIATLTPYVSRRHSASSVLEYVADSKIAGPLPERVGVLSRNTFSLYWTSLAWKTELSRHVIVEYVDLAELRNSDLGLLLVREGKGAPPSEVTDTYDFVIQKGEWNLYRRKAV